MNNGGPTWKWLTGVLVGILLSVAAYQWAQLEHRVDAEEQRSSTFQASQVELHALIESKFGEVYRRLDRIEKILDTSGSASNRGFPTTKR